MTHTNQYTNITSATPYRVTLGPCTLVAIVVNATAAGTITITDGSTVVGTLKASIVEGTYTYNCNINTSLTVTTGAASDVTVIWRV